MFAGELRPSLCWRFKEPAIFSSQLLATGSFRRKDACSNCTTRVTHAFARYMTFQAASNAFRNHQNATNSLAEETNLLSVVLFLLKELGKADDGTVDENTPDN
jgi:hypothetical protein